MDFVPKKWKWATTQDRECARIEHEENYLLWHKKVQNQNNRYIPIEKVEVPKQIELKALTGRMSGLCDAIVCGKEKVENTRPESSRYDREEISKCLIEIDEAMLNRRAIAAVDTSVDDRCMAAHWIITTLQNEPRIEQNIYSSKWVHRALPAAEGLGTFNLIKDIAKKTSHLTLGEIIFCADNKKIINKVASERLKESQHAQEAGVTVEGSNDAIKSATIDVSLEYSNDKLRSDKTFQQEPRLMLMKECNIKSKGVRAELGPTPTENILWIVDSTPVYHRIIKDKAAKILMREIDAQQHEKEHMQNKIPGCYEWIEIKACNSFYEGVGAGTLKCTTGFNHYGCRDAQINKGLVNEKCLRCNQKEA